MTNRALVLAALSGGPAAVLGAPCQPGHRADGRRRCARSGCRCTADGERVDVDGHGGLRGDADVDCGLAGTVMRFLPPLAALADGPVRFDGDPRARERPMGPVLDALRALGRRGRRATRCRSCCTARGGLLGGEVALDASGSSQFVSGLLLSARALRPRARGARTPGRRVPVAAARRDDRAHAARRPAPQVDDAEPDVWRVAPGPIQASDWTIEPDLSAAAPFLAAAAVTGGAVTVAGWPAQHRPARRRRCCDLLRAMGGELHLDAARPDRARRRPG